MAAQPPCTNLQRENNRNTCTSPPAKGDESQARGVLWLAMKAENGKEHWQSLRSRPSRAGCAEAMHRSRAAAAGGSPLPVETSAAELGQVPRPDLAGHGVGVALAGIHAQGQAHIKWQAGAATSACWKATTPQCGRQEAEALLRCCASAVPKVAGGSIAEAARDSKLQLTLILIPRAPVCSGAPSARRTPAHAGTRHGVRWGRRCSPSCTRCRWLPMHPAR